MTGYTLHQSEFIVNNMDDIFEDLKISHRLFEKMFPNKDSTWTYDRYNIFALTAPSTAFYQIYKEMRTLVRSQLGEDRPLWFQAWLNYHTPDQLLDWHEHGFDYHGYISIDPKNTKTVFKEYEIINKPGQMYFGPGNRDHKVEAIGDRFDGVRTTIGFDIHTIPNSPYIKRYVERPYGNLSLMPLL